MVLITELKTELKNPVSLSNFHQAKENSVK